MQKLNPIAARVRARHIPPAGSRTGDEGATTAEYALLAALVGGICIAAVTGLGNQISTLFNSLAGSSTLP